MFLSCPRRDWHLMSHPASRLCSCRKSWNLWVWYRSRLPWPNLPSPLMALIPFYWTHPGMRCVLQTQCIRRLLVLQMMCCEVGAMSMAVMLGFFFLGNFLFGRGELFLLPFPLFHFSMALLRRLHCLRVVLMTVHTRDVWSVGSQFGKVLNSAIHQPVAPLLLQTRFRVMWVKLARCLCWREQVSLRIVSRIVLSTVHSKLLHMKRP